MANVTNGAFSDHCYNNMWELFRTPHDEVGSEFKGPRRNRAITNCVIYVFNVLNYGYKQMGRADVLAKLKEMFPRQNGMELAGYLTTQGWKAHYWNPDVYNPRESDPNGASAREHKFSFVEGVRTKEYYKVPLSGMIVGYNKQVKTKKETAWIPTIPTPFGTIPLPTTIEKSTENPANLRAFEDLKKVRFAAGFNKGGTHCFLFTYGEVLEVHWDQEGANLYGKTPLYGYEWNSGVVLTPPDSTYYSRSIDDIAAETR